MSFLLEFGRAFGTREVGRAAGIASRSNTPGKPAKTTPAEESPPSPFDDDWTEQHSSAVDLDAFSALSKKESLSRPNPDLWRDFRRCSR